MFQTRPSQLPASRFAREHLPQRGCRLRTPISVQVPEATSGKRTNMSVTRFSAASRSRSGYVPHFGHIHARASSPCSSCSRTRCEQVLLPGGKRSQAITFLLRLVLGGTPVSIVREYIERQQMLHRDHKAATPSALSFPARNDGTCRMPGQAGRLACTFARGNHKIASSSQASVGTLSNPLWSPWIRLICDMVLTWISGSAWNDGKAEPIPPVH